MKITEFKKIPTFTNPGRYAIDQSLDYLVKFIQTEVDEYGLVLNPDFQRGHVWTEQQQIAYIKFLLRNGQTGRDLYFNNPSWHTEVPPGAYNDYVCVDGLQRITAIQRFVNNEIQVFGSYFREFTDKRHINMNTVRVHINDLSTRDEVLTWYIEMNDGGTPHSKQEIERVKAMLSKTKEQD